MSNKKKKFDHVNKKIHLTFFKSQQIILQKLR